MAAMHPFGGIYTTAISDSISKAASALRANLARWQLTFPKFQKLTLGLRERSAPKVRFCTFTASLLLLLVTYRSIMPLLTNIWCAVCTFCFMFAQSRVRGHAFLAIPKARNVLANSYYCPHCLNAGGVNVTRGTIYPNNEDKHGMCGDRKSGPLDHEAGGIFATGQITATYEQGSAIQLATAITTYHKGLIEYRICRYPAGNPESERAALTDECLEQHVLTQVSSSSNGDTPPQMPGSRYYFLGNASEAGYDPPKLFYSTFQLPEDLVCDGKEFKCVLQMHMVTGNTCSDPNIPDEYKLSYFPNCGGGTWPEEFWNCADISVLPKGFGPKALESANDSRQPAFSPALMQGPKAASYSNYQSQHPSLFVFIVQKTFYPLFGKGGEARAVQLKEDEDQPVRWRRAFKRV